MSISELLTTDVKAVIVGIYGFNSDSLWNILISGELGQLFGNIGGLLACVYVIIGIIYRIRRNNKSKIK